MFCGGDSTVVTKLITLRTLLSSVGEHTHQPHTFTSHTHSCWKAARHERVLSNRMQVGSATCGTSWHMLATSSGVTLTLCGNMNRQLMMFCRMSTSCKHPLSLAQMVVDLEVYMCSCLGFFTTTECVSMAT